MGSGARYTAQTVADFLGWTNDVVRSGVTHVEAQRKVLFALSALEYVERGMLNREDFTRLGNKEAGEVIQRTRSELAVQEQAAKQAEVHAADLAKTARAAADEEKAAAIRVTKAAAAEAAAKTLKGKNTARAQAEKAESERVIAAALQQQADLLAKAGRDRAAQERSAANKAAPVAAAKVGRAVADSIRDGEGTKGARTVQQKASGRKERSIGDINAAIDKYSRILNDLLSPEHRAGKPRNLWNDLEELLPYIVNSEEVRLDRQKELVGILEDLSDRALSAAQFLQAGDTPVHVPSTRQLAINGKKGK